jgi:hypothetical protein
MARVGRFQRRIDWMLKWEFCRGRSEKITLCVGPHGLRTRHRALGLMQGGSVLLPSGSPDQVWRTPLGLLQCFDVRLGSVGELFSLATHLCVPVHECAERTTAGRSTLLEKKCFSGGLRLRLLPRHHHYCENHHRRCHRYRENRLHRGNRFRRCYCASRHRRIPARSWRVSAYFRCGC